MTGFSRPRDHASPSSSNSNSSCSNVFHLLARREVAPRRRHVAKWNWGEASKSKSSSSSRAKKDVSRDARRGLLSWVEADSLRHLSAKYCPLLPPPRSTIAAAFSPDGKVLASTHGDHTVKIIDCETGSCLKVLVGHRRTPWVVRFHPLHPQILASGSLDQEVRLWDANTAECIISHHFYRPIASIAFHANGEIIAVASGHKLYIWHYNKKGEASSPVFVLKTRRSLRAVHFHPHAAPYLLTAEVNDLDSSDSSMTEATSIGYLQYPPPAVFVANIHPTEHVSFSSESPYVSLPFFFMPSYPVDESRAEIQHTSHDAGSSSLQIESSAAVQFQADTNATEQNDNIVSPMDTVSKIPTNSQTGTEYPAHTTFSNGIDIRNHMTDGMETDETRPSERSQHGNPTDVYSLNGMLHGLSRQTANLGVLSEFGQFQQLFSSRDPSGWELPFLQGWLMGQSQVGIPSTLPHRGISRDIQAQQIGSSVMANNNVDVAMQSSTMSGSINIPSSSTRSGLRNHFSQLRTSVSESSNLAALNTPHDGSDIQTIMSRIQSELATSVAAAAAAELPCTVKLRVWSHDIKNPNAPLNADKCRLTIPHAVLCSEMGAHFSPCGRFLAACVACMLPHIEADPGLQTPVHQESGVATSPTRHPISAHQVMYELRIYSLEEATFGSVLASRAIRAAHCLTSIQFSPTSEHILLAYGRRHGSLLKSIVIDGETTLPIYTVLEVYRVSDMELVRVLPSAEDEVNVACFHPFAGGGLVYGTKEGKLRILHYDGARAVNGTGPSYFPEETIIGVSQ